jgi:MEMO1 family protein
LLSDNEGVSVPLPPLRLNLDFMPSPDPARPGLYIRDPYGYSESTLLVPPVLVPALDCFDGRQSSLDLRSELVRLTGQIQVSEMEKNLFEALNDAGFLDNDRYRELKAYREAEFAAEPERPAIFAGAAYPEDVDELNGLLADKIGTGSGAETTVGIAAPHASPDGGWATYRAAYTCLPNGESLDGRTFVILGTSHYGAPDKFGLTRKRFLTPFGNANTNQDLVNELAGAAPGAIRMEDYCHSVEHSIEFQVMFLQYLYGPDINILPILCGPFVKSIYGSEMPESAEDVRRFFDSLSEIRTRLGRKLFWVLGIDMAHIGRRYGDGISASAHEGEMLTVAARDRERIDHINGGDAEGYWSLVQSSQDDLKWCGASPLYTFLKTQPKLKGELLDYHQWQIDPQSVVSFGALRFEAAS